MVPIVLDDSDPRLWRGITISPQAQEEGAGFNIETEEGKDGIEPLPLPDMHLGLGAVKEGSAQGAAEPSAAEDASGDGTEEVVSPEPLAPGVDALADEAIIVCATEERALLVAEAAKQLGLPYARFRILFVEGRLQEGGEAFMEPPKTISMQVTEGLLHNRFCCRNVNRCSRFILPKKVSRCHLWCFAIVSLSSRCGRRSATTIISWLVT